MNEIIISSDNAESIVCVIEEGVISEIYCYELNKEHIDRNIYIGKVKDVIDGMQAAFIDIGLEKNVYIATKDAMPKTNTLTEKIIKEPKISEILHVGDKIMVQIRKNSSGTKAAKVSTHITISGKYAVLMPDTDITTVSQKIESEQEKNRLVEILKRNLPNGFGAIARTEALGADEYQISKDIEKLVQKWEIILEKYENEDKVGLLYNEQELTYKIFKDLINRRTKKVYVNDATIYNDLSELCDGIDLEIIYKESEDLISEFGLVSEFEKARNRKIWLECGGYIVIDKTEALTAIDVNSGKYVGNKNLEETAYEVNKEAAVQIMHQLRLRDIGGIVVVDYINLQDKEKQEKIIEIMQNEAKKDRSRVSIKGYTELNLVELTRKTINI